MGSKCSPAVACTFMAWFEEQHLAAYPLKPLLWKRYVDDVIMVWQHGEEELHKFCDFLNSRHDRIKFTMNFSRDSINFLDTTLRQDPDGRLNTTLYCKPNDSHNYLQYDSAHKESVKTGLPYSEFLRVRRICTFDADFEQNCALLAAHFIRRGYPIDVLDQSFEKVKQTTRSDLLREDISPPPSTSTQNQQATQLLRVEQANLFSITTFNPAGNPNQQAIKENWTILGTSNITQPLFHSRVIHGNRRCPNLRDSLVHSRLKLLSTTNIGFSGTTIHDCTTSTCRYCPRLNTSGFIISPTTGKKSRCCSNVTCNSSNLIYCIKCNHCNMLYVGQTKRKLKLRMVEHFRYISKPDLTQPLGVHFNQPDHPKLDAAEIYVLKFIKANPDSDRAKTLRDEHELRWIHRLRSALPYGLNSMD